MQRNHVAVAEDHVPDLPRPRLRADLEGAAPVVPDRAALDDDVLEYVVHDAVVQHFRLGQDVVEPLHADRVVEGAEERVADAHLAAVVHVDAVRVVAPVADDLDVVDEQVVAADWADGVERGIADRNALDSHVVAKLEANRIKALHVGNRPALPALFLSKRWVYGARHGEDAA